MKNIQVSVMITKENGLVQLNNIMIMEEYPITDLRIQLNEKVVSSDRFLFIVNKVHKNPKLFTKLKNFIERWQN